MLTSQALIGRPDTISGTLMPHGLSADNPLCKQELLDATEVEIARQAILNYNAIIRQLADDYNLALVDVFDYLNRVKDGGVYDGVEVSAAFIIGGAFSLDGIHLTERGNALLANEFLRAINSHYDARIPLVDATRYPGVLLP